MPAKTHWRIKQVQKICLYTIVFSKKKKNRDCPYIISNIILITHLLFQSLKYIQLFQSTRDSRDTRER